MPGRAGGITGRRPLELPYLPGFVGTTVLTGSRIERCLLRAGGDPVNGPPLSLANQLQRLRRALSHLRIPHECAFSEGYGALTTRKPQQGITAKFGLLNSRWAERTSAAVR